ncbi:MAG: MFS transporter [Pseudomonadota bacterium]
MRKNGNPFLLLAGDGLSAFGTWIDFLAILTLAAYQFHVSSYEMAIVSAAGVLPGMLLSPFIGRLCDKGNPQKVLLVSMVARVVATGAIILCHDFYLFLGLVAVRSVFAMVAPPAINVMAVRSVDTADLPRFYSLLNVINNAAKVLAPAIGTISSSLASETVALGMSLLFSAAAIAVFAAVRIRPQEAMSVPADHAAGKPAPLAPRLVPLLWIATTYAFFIFLVNNLFPLVLQREGFDKALLGLLISCSGAGNILSGLWLARKASAMRGDMRELVIPALLQAIGFGLIGITLWLKLAHAAEVLPVLFFLIGTCSAWYAIATNVHVATHFSASIGSVWGVLQAWQSAMILLAPMVGALVLDAWGPEWLFFFSTATAIVSFALFYGLRALGVPRLHVPLAP